jgi:hypothetical protein
VSEPDGLKALWNFTLVGEGNVTLKEIHDDRPSLMASRLIGIKNVGVEVGSVGSSGPIS